MILHQKLTALNHSFKSSIHDKPLEKIDQLESKISGIPSLSVKLSPKKTKNKHSSKIKRKVKMNKKKLKVVKMNNFKKKLKMNHQILKCPGKNHQI